MIEKNLYELKIDPELQSLHIFYTEAKLQKLEENICKTGAVRPILIWNGVIVDGHKRYAIFHKRKIPFFIKEASFNNKNEIKEFICRNNLLRRDLTEEYKRYFIGKIFQIKYAESLNRVTVDHTSETKTEIDKGNHKCKLAGNVAEQFRVSASTILSYNNYVAAIDIIYLYLPPLAEKILTSKITLTLENVIEITRLPSIEFQILCQHLNHGQTEYLFLEESKRKLKGYKLQKFRSEERKVIPPKAGIKETPLYDPDAELSSLRLTIPSWISSIQRIIEKSDIISSTAEAKGKLFLQLSELKTVVNELSQLLKERS